MQVGYSTRVAANMFAQVRMVLEQRFASGIKELAETGQKSAKGLVSGPSPSRPGEPPGIVTGTLRDSITIAQVDAHHWFLLAAAYYSLYLEFGTEKMAARPFMRPTAKTLHKMAPGIIQRAMRG